ncbi:MAG TPA: recombinase family protein [Pirellulales bacterium]
MRIIGYIRVSTEEQSRDGVSLQAQRAKLIAYADLYELKLVRIIEDAGESAKSLKRPGLQELLALLRKGEADGLVIAKLDRLTRSVADWQVLIDGYFGERSRFGKQLFSVGDSIDTRTAAGRLVLNVLLSVAQWEREAIGERTRDALQHKIRNHERCGKVRFGFDLAYRIEIVHGKQKSVGILLPNAAEQEAISHMLAMRRAGRTLREIAAELTRLGIPTKEGRAPWTHTAVARIVGRPEVATAEVKRA